MSKIDEIKAAIERLPSKEVTELYQWFSEKDWAKWDHEAAAGAL